MPGEMVVEQGDSDAKKFYIVAKGEAVGLITQVTNFQLTLSCFCHRFVTVL